MLSDISQSQKQILYDFIYMRHLEGANSQRRKVDWCLPGAVRKGNGKLVFNADSWNTAG